MCLPPSRRAALGLRVSYRILGMRPGVQTQTVPTAEAWRLRGTRIQVDLITGKAIACRVEYGLLPYRLGGAGLGLGDRETERSDNYSAPKAPSDNAK